MCRIAGIASHQLPIEEMEYTVAAMCHAQRHGGPDDKGLYTDHINGVVFGHRRLSLLDLEATGHQPMQYANRRFTITYNGEVYNYRELKAELLQHGHRFCSGTDTEVILAAFAQWGTASFAKLEGMFAFALFDRLETELYLVRDVLGIKPLYYWLQRQTLVFASEVRAFYQFETPPEEHPHWPVFLMAYGHLPEPITTLKNVKPLQKGSFLQLNTRTGRTTTGVFEFLSYYEKESNRQDIIGNLKTTFGAAIQRHLVSDVPVGVFLSGGIDSSIIAVQAAKVLGSNLNTLSIHFQEGNYSEKVHQEKVAGQLHAVHHQHLLTKNEFHFHLPESIAAMDMPSSDGINTWFISRLARETGLKAVLAGIGGDELFGGYPSFSRARMTALLHSFPNALLRSSRYSYNRKLRRFAYLSLPGAKGQYLFLRGFFNPVSIAGYLGLEEEQVWQILEQDPDLPDIHFLSPSNRISWIELNLYMQNQLLRDADVMSMAHGVELRVPFLDKRLVKMVLALSSRQKYEGTYHKQLLIDSFQNELPAAVWQRKKMGFSFPFAEWLKEDEWLRSKMMSGGKASIRILKRFDQGTLHWSWLLTALLLRTKQYESQPAFSLT